MITDARWDLALLSLVLLTLVGLWRYEGRDATPTEPPDEEYALFVG